MVPPDSLSQPTQGDDEITGLEQALLHQAIARSVDDQARRRALHESQQAAERLQLQMAMLRDACTAMSEESSSRQRQQADACGHSTTDVDAAVSVVREEMEASLYGVVAAHERTRVELVEVQAELAKARATIDSHELTIEHMGRELHDRRQAMAALQMAWAADQQRHASARVANGGPTAAADSLLASGASMGTAGDVSDAARAADATASKAALALSSPIVAPGEAAAAVQSVAAAAEAAGAELERRIRLAKLESAFEALSERATEAERTHAVEVQRLTDEQARLVARHAEALEEAALDAREVRGVQRRPRLSRILPDEPP